MPPKRPPRPAAPSEATSGSAKGREDEADTDTEPDSGEEDALEASQVAVKNEGSGKSDFLSLLEAHVDEEEAALEKGGDYKQEAGLLTRTARRLLSKRQKKNRYHDDRFDLDLTYITPRIIAMSFPASGLEATYRNSVEDVGAFLNERHGEGFMIVNVAEKSYPGDGMCNQVLDFGWPDHMAPPMDRLCGAVQAMDGWNRSDDKNVVVVHCKGGKGRTGVIIACYMLQSRVFDDAEKAMYHFAVKRFLSKNPNKTGITGQGQRRYVHYFKEMIEGKKAFYDKPMFLESVIIRGVPNFDGHGGCRPLLRLFSFPMGTTQAELLFEWPTDFPQAVKTEWNGKHEAEVMIMVNRMVDRSDILARCYHRKGKGAKKKDKMWRLQFHTCAVDDDIFTATFRKADLDDAKQFPDDCTVTFNFDRDRTPPDDTGGKFNLGAGLAHSYATASVDVNHAAAVLFEAARTGGSSGREPKPVAPVPGIMAMSDEERMEVMEMVKQGQMSISEAEAFVHKRSSGESAPAVLAPAATEPTEGGGAVARNPFRRHSSGSALDLQESSDKPTRRLSAIPDDPFANPITAHKDPFASNSDSAPPSAQPAANPFKAQTADDPKTHRRAASEHNPFAGGDASAEPAAQSKLQPFWSEGNTASTSASAPATPMRSVTSDTAANPFTPQVSETIEATEGLAANPTSSERGSEPNPFLEASASAAGADNSQAVAPSEDANPFTAATVVSSNPFG